MHTREVQVSAYAPLQRHLSAPRCRLLPSPRNPVVAIAFAIEEPLVNDPEIAPKIRPFAFCALNFATYRRKPDLHFCQFHHFATHCAPLASFPPIFPTLHTRLWPAYGFLQNLKIPLSHLSRRAKLYIHFTLFIHINPIESFAFILT